MFAPHPWEVTRERVAPDCQWSHFGLVVAFPGWKMFSSSNGGVFGAAQTEGRADPIHHRRQMRCSAIPGKGLRGQTYEVAAGSHFLNNPMVSVYTPNVPDFPTTAATVILHYRKLDTTNRVSGAFGFANISAGIILGCHLPMNDGVVYWDFGGNTAGVTRLSVGGLTFRDDVWAFTTGPRGMEIWQNGIKRASNGASPTRTNTAADWGLFSYSTTTSDFAESGACLLYNRQLEVEAIQALTIDPWTPFRPARPKMSRSISAAAIAAIRARVPAIIGG